MGYYINKGNGGFRESRNGEYVDKSGLIGFMNSVLGTEQKYVCVTRARRFGKTLAAKMLYAYYDKSCDSGSLFSDLEIASHPSFEEHLNKYPVIFVDMTDFLADKSLYGERFIDGLKQRVSADLFKAYPQVELAPDTSLQDALFEIYQSTGEKFIFIIDEWDAPLREYRGNKKVEEDWVGFLRSMFKSATVSEALAGVYITGILPIVRYNTQSALNNFKEYNLINPEPIGEYLGFTEEEVQGLCQKYDMNYAELKAWYDGYQVGDKMSIFNPNSVMTAIARRKCRSYWTSTGAGDELSPYLRYELRDDVQQLIDGESIFVDVSSFENNLDDIDTRDKAFTALIHLGYLSYDGRKARIPNMELMIYYGNGIRRAELGGLSKVLGRSESLIEYLLECKEKKAAEILELSHDDICGAQEYNSEQTLYTTLRESLFFAHRDFIFHREYPTGKGFADMVLIPRPGISFPAMVIELKNDKSSESALAQIRERNYPAKVAEYSGEMLLVGVNYDPVTKEHQCTIERILK